MNFEYTSQDKSLNVKLEFIQGTPQRNYPRVGKSYPKTTQCLVFVNGFLQGNGIVVKNVKDEDNDVIAYKRSAQKALAKILTKEVRSDIWGLLHKL